MRNFIGQIHDTRNLTASQLTDFENRIKTMLRLDTIQITSVGNGIYSVTTDDTNIVDFHIDNYNNDNISLVKYHSSNDQGQRDDAGATLTRQDIIAKE